jgi:hypothetical protein
VNGVPYGVEIRNLIREKLDEVQRSGNSKNPGMRDDLQ